MYLIPDMFLSLFIVVQDICSDRNLLFMAIFRDIGNKIAYTCIVLVEIDKFWGRALWKLTKQLLVFN